MNTFFVSLLKKWTLQSALPHHICVHRDTSKGRTKAENLLQQSTACEIQATSGDQSRLRHPQGLRVTHIRQDEKVTADTSAPSVCSEMQWPSQDDPQQIRKHHGAAGSTMLNCPCPYQLGRAGNSNIYVLNCPILPSPSLYGG